MTVITNQKGDIVATYRHEQPKKGKPKLRLHALPKQTMHEIDIPVEIHEVNSAAELHSRLKEYGTRSGPGLGRLLGLRCKRSRRPRSGTDRGDSRLVFGGRSASTYRTAGGVEGCCPARGVAGSWPAAAFDNPVSCQ